jgi:hypothetical protein
MTPVRIIQTFVRVCADCPNCTYYSGGMSHCTLTEELVRPDDKQYKVGDRCPLPYAGPPAESYQSPSQAEALSK